MIESLSTVYQTKRGTNTICNALYNGEPCYAITHVPTGHTECIDHNETLLGSIIERIEKSTALACNRERSGNVLKFYETETERSISLRLFAYAAYNGMSLENVRGRKICLYKSNKEDDVLDIRSKNLYAAGDIRLYTESHHISIVTRPDSAEKFIAITFPYRKNKKVEYVEYSPELLQMLASSSYCTLSYNSRNDRVSVNIHVTHSKDGYVSHTLSRFVLIYYLHFDEYRDKPDGIRQFIQDYRTLSLRHNGEEAGHANANKWNNCVGNLLFMDKSVNNDMRNYIKWFAERYQTYTAVNSAGETLIEFINGSESRYYLCPNPEDFADWQDLFLGKGITKKLQVMHLPTDASADYLTPRGQVKERIVDIDTARENEPDFWIWLDHRDNLLSINREQFYVHKKGGQSINDIPGIVSSLLHGIV